MRTLNEDDVEAVALEWLRELDWSTVHGPGIGPEAERAERAGFDGEGRARWLDRLGSRAVLRPYGSKGNAFQKWVTETGLTARRRARARRRS